MFGPPSLTITEVQPSPAIEGQPLHLKFRLTNTSAVYSISGMVSVHGVRFQLIGGQANIDQLAPGATVFGDAWDNAPPVGKDVPIGLTLDAWFDNGSPACGTLCSTPATATADTSVDIQGVYYVELDNFHVDQTRANGPCCSSDTDYVVLSARQKPSGVSSSVNSAGAITAQQGGTYTPLAGGPLVLGPFYALPDDSNLLVFNYSIVNSGHSSALDILNAMTQAGLQAAGAAAGVSPGAAAGSQGLASLLGSLTSQLFANCDGPVVTDQLPQMTGGLLASMTASGPHYETNDDQGSNSPAGCGGDNSEYHSTWRIIRDHP